MRMLVINAGSSSLKFTVFDFSWKKRQTVLATGQVECLGLPVSYLTYQRSGHTKSKMRLELEGERKEKGNYFNHTDAIRIICDKILDRENGDGVVKNIEDIIAIGHRAVHGGEKMTKPVIIDESVKNIMRECISFAPIHNPANLAGIEACEKFFPGVPNIAVFDTAFHQTMPPESYLYAIPYELYKKYGIRKYGFHGTSHRYVAEATANLLRMPLEKLKLITCHLGNGCSMAAINKGKVIDTSMGMTPLEGLVMGTRCGDLDPAIVLALIDKGLGLKEVDNMLNKKSGLLGMAGINSGDMREIIEAGDNGNLQAALALNMFIRRTVKYIGAYYAQLNGADVIVFTGGIGENSYTVRAKIVEQISAFSIYLDSNVNSNSIGTQAIISTKESKLKAIVMPTNEELMIATQSIDLLLSEGQIEACYNLENQSLHDHSLAGAKLRS